MEKQTRPEDIFSKFPIQVTKRLVQDISIETWAAILKENPQVRNEVMGGFSFRPNKLDRVLYQPATITRLQRRLGKDIDFLDEVLDAWSEESSALGYLSMLDSEYVAERWRQVRDLLGPERFCLGLFCLGAFEEEMFSNLLAEDDFWTSAPNTSMYELLLLPLAAWGQFVRENPEAAEGLKGGLDLELGFDFGLGSPPAKREDEEHPPPREIESGEPFKKVEKKLQKVQDELNRTSEQLTHVKAENEELRKKVKEWETEFERKVRESATNLRKEWFQKYRGLDAAEISTEAARLDSLLQRTRRALELQGRADEEYGTISDLRAKLLEIDLSLEKIHSVYANSLVVHKEVEKVKEALLDEKKRLLRVPGIDKVTGGAKRGTEGELASRINFMDPIPANLPKLNRLRITIEILFDSGIITDRDALDEALRHKTKQIQERLYSQFEPGTEALSRDKPKSFRNLDDFVGSGESKRYEIYIDGYNVLLRVHGEDEEKVRRGFTELREQFVGMVLKRSPRFAKVFLVFDGVENSRDVRGNTEIIYTDKKHRSADAAIIEKIKAKKDKKILLVTADEEIINATRDRIFALIDPIDFYMFVFE